VSGCGNIQPYALFQIVEFPYHMSIVEMSSCGSTAGCECRSLLVVAGVTLPLTLVPLRLSSLEDAVNELGLGQMDVSLAVPFDVDFKEVGNGLFNGDLELGSLHVLHHFQQLGTLWASEDGIISVEDINAILLDEYTCARGQVDEANTLELLDQVQ